MTRSEVLERPRGSERVLLVDDRKDNLLALEAVLEPLCFELLTASSGLEALHCLLDGGIAAILLDVQMPDMDGFETAALLKSRAATRHIPIVFLTAISPDLDLQLRGYGVGAIDYICKPFDPDVLRAKVRALVEMSGELFPPPPGDLAQPTVAPPKPSKPRRAEARAGSRDSPSGGGAPEGREGAAFRDLERVVDLNVEMGSHAPRTVRDAVRSALDAQPSEVVDSVALLASELVTNAVIHASTSARVCLDVGSSVIRVEVVDGSALVPSLRAAGPFNDNGRGLQLVRLLAARCGWTRLAMGKSVWFELDLPDPTCS